MLSRTAQRARLARAGHAYAVAVSTTRAVRTVKRCVHTNSPRRTEQAHQVIASGISPLMAQAMSMSFPPSSSAAAASFHSSASARAVVKPFVLADIGEGITECEIVKWNVEVGQVVDEFDPIVEVMSDKATVEITSPYAGKVLSLNGAPGDVVKVGKNLCEIEMQGEGEGGSETTTATTPGATAEEGQTASTPPTATLAPTAATPSTEGNSSASSRAERPPHRGSNGEVWATPATRRVAREHRVDLGSVTGTGPQGRVTKGDVLAYVENGGAAKSTSSSPEPSRPHPSAPRASPSATASSVASQSSTSSSTSTSVAMSPVRKAMFRAMTASLQIPHFAYSETLDVTAIERLRLSLNRHIPLSHRKTLKPADEAQLHRLGEWGVGDSTRVPEEQRYDRMTLLPILIKALSLAMAQHPLFSCSLSTSSGEPVLSRRSSHDISIALSAPSGGLYTPLLPSVDRSSAYDLSSSIANLLHCSLSSSPPKFPDAHNGKGTITLSNVGVIGGTTTHPIVPPTGQLAIGALGRMRVEPRYVAADRAKAKKVAQGLEELELGEELRIEPRLLMDVTFSADHRVVEGVELAKLVESWKRLIEEPERIVGLAR